MSDKSDESNHPLRKAWREHAIHRQVLGPQSLDPEPVSRTGKVRRRTTPPSLVKPIARADSTLVDIAGLSEAASEGFSRQMKKLDIEAWFADPHAPWQGGCNDNTNGLLGSCSREGRTCTCRSGCSQKHIMADHSGNSLRAMDGGAIKGNSTAFRPQLGSFQGVFRVSGRVESRQLEKKLGGK